MTAEIMTAYLDEMKKLAKAPNLTTVVKNTPMDSGTGEIPTARSLKIDLSPGSPGKSRVLPKPRPAVVKPTMPSQGKQERKLAPPEI